MELTPLRYFRVIAAHGHLTRAARALGVTQPALSSMLKKLEAETGAALVHRSGRGVDLTEAGRVFLARADDALRAADDALSSVRQLMGLESGTIRVGGGATATTYLLPPVISRLRHAHPGLRYYVREGGSRATAAAVLAGELDLGIVTLPVLLPGSDDLACVPLVEDELLLITPPDAAPTPRAKRPAGFRWEHLKGRGLVAFEAGSAVRDMIDRAAAAAGVRLDPVMELRSIESITQMVRAGIGVGFVSRFALPPGEGLPCLDRRLTRSLAIVKRRDRALSPASAEFERALLHSVRERRPTDRTGGAPR
jgi:DNA-binding transcriptional LysR family regulator